MTLALDPSFQLPDSRLDTSRCSPHEVPRLLPDVSIDSMASLTVPRLSSAGPRKWTDWSAEAKDFACFLSQGTVTGALPGAGFGMFGEMNQYESGIPREAMLETG